MPDSLQGVYAEFVGKFLGKSLSYADHKFKESFHRDGRRLLKLLAAELEYPPQSYDLSCNKAGVAVSGEITLHTDNLYVQLSQHPFSGKRIAFRICTCKARKDHHTGPNNYADLEWGGLEKLLWTCRRVLQAAAH